MHFKLMYECFGTRIFQLFMDAEMKTPFKVNNGTELLDVMFTVSQGYQAMFVGDGWSPLITQFDPETPMTSIVPRLFERAIQEAAEQNAALLKTAE